MRISPPGVKKCSMPSQLSLSTVVPQAAASKSRPEGQYPITAMSLRVTLSVSLEEEKNAECSGGATCCTNQMLRVHGKV